VFALEYEHDKRCTMKNGYRYFLSIPTRWKDNDVFGHVNNVEYYSYVDTVITSFLVRFGGLDIHRGPLVPLCAESHCTFKREISYPDTVEAGLRVVHVGRSSVRYEIGVFREGESETAADAWFVHVFAGREDDGAPIDSPSTQSIPIPVVLRARTSFC
jgi:acyl-CoA thioester hydrolase